MRKRAIDLLFDPRREFAASVFVQLEVMPKALWMRNQAEQEVYERFFDQIKHWPSDTDAVIPQAQIEAAKFGLGGMDALHIAAALPLKADELVTMEKLTKPIHRTRSIKVVMMR